jgi:hypothetical protein
VLVQAQRVDGSTGAQAVVVHNYNTVAPARYLADSFRSWTCHTALAGMAPKSRHGGGYLR